MGGGLMQLVAYGAQDIYLTGNPQITFFKVVYRRHTNFAMESIEQAFTGSVDFGRKCVCTIDRNGDLLHKIHPLAGQGLNMVIRDIKDLIELIKARLDIGLIIDQSICVDFERKTKHKNYIFSNGIDIVHEFFKF